jgi:hypothetical protein
MAALVATRWNPIIRPFYQRLRAAGEAPKVALVARADYRSSSLSKYFSSILLDRRTQHR